MCPYVCSYVCPCSLLCTWPPLTLACSLCQRSRALSKSRSGSPDAPGEERGGVGGGEADGKGSDGLVLSEEGVSRLSGELNASGGVCVRARPSARSVCACVCARERVEVCVFV